MCAQPQKPKKIQKIAHTAGFGKLVMYALALLVIALMSFFGCDFDRYLIGP